MAVEGPSLFNEENAKTVTRVFPDVMAGLAKNEEDQNLLIEPGSPGL